MPGIESKEVKQDYLAFNIYFSIHFKFIYIPIVLNMLLYIPEYTFPKGRNKYHLG